MCGNCLGSLQVNNLFRFLPKFTLKLSLQILNPFYSVVIKQFLANADVS